jgi:hypothetical protein
MPLLQMSVTLQYCFPAVLLCVLAQVMVLTHLKHADVVLPVDLITWRVPQPALAQVAQQLRSPLEEVQAVLTKVQLLHTSKETKPSTPGPS